VTLPDLALPLTKALVRRALPRPILARVRRIRRTGGGIETLSARYCYAVWMHHLVKARDNGLPTAPASVAEIGPGASLGVGIAALLTGADRYVAFDVVREPVAPANLRLFDELEHLLQERAVIPGGMEFPELRPRLSTLAFPDDILGEERLTRALDPVRTATLRQMVQEDRVEYVAPWWHAESINSASIDLVVSQAVMEHVEALPATYAAMFKWVKPGGFISHQIDLRSHGTSRKWNGHWAYPRWLWSVQDGIINRQPVSAHLTAIRDAGFSVVAVEREAGPAGIGRGALAPEWRGLSDDDLYCQGAFVQAVRPVAVGRGRAAHHRTTLNTQTA